jgi:hypothetical protein
MNQENLKAETNQKSTPQEPLMYKKVGVWDQILAKTPKTVKELLGRFYSNKKVFWPITIAFGTILLVVIMGAIFGKTKTATPAGKISPTAAPLTIPLATPKTAPASDTEIKLNELKIEIENLDVGQKRLTPPILNFDIKF